LADVIKKEFIFDTSWTCWRHRIFSGRSVICVRPFFPLVTACFSLSLFEYFDQRNHHVSTPGGLNQLLGKGKTKERKLALEVENNLDYKNIIS
jgi:hypothetical protein